MPPTHTDGYWGKPTSTIDWCEKNYEFNYYVAEMTNTISNIMMILPPLWGISEVYRQGFERRFVYCHMLLLIVGLGSWAFHMTLLYEMQLFDELPMVWGTSVQVYCLYQIGKPINRRMIANVPLFLTLTSLGVGFAALYLFLPQPILHHSYYGLLVIISYYLEVRLLKAKRCQICKQLFIFSTFIYLFGFFLWSIDKIYCPQLEAIRSSVSVLINPMTQLHGWWHIMAGYGTYLQILFTIHANYDFKKSKGQSSSQQLRPCNLGFSLRWFKRRKN